MFVKVIRWIVEDAAGGPRFSKISIYECKRLHIRSADHGVHKDGILCEMEDDSGFYVGVHVERKPDNEVYVMNDRGQTIDTYKWPPNEKDGSAPRKQDTEAKVPVAG